MALPEGALPLVVGTALALGALTLVLAPLVSGLTDTDATRRPKPSGADAGTDDGKSSSVDALREIEFDRATGKLSDTDYAELKTRYTRLALEELRANDAAEAISSRVTTDGRLVHAMSSASVDPSDPVEAAIVRARANQRSCSVCGPRSEPDAIYCSDCGRYLPGTCGTCGSTVDAPGARFCSGCGNALAA
ncbi:zinc ribbon domain-containing protein [Gemmatimonas aurantiaca]|uniref:zinc ribbon domain-containing protein n=1 Tax=Gemmatimonas aurantiaca TaxID=173480 RepID=UPI00301C8E0C